MVNNSSNLKNLYNTIYNDQEIIDIYKKIEELENNGMRYAFHNFEHIKNVNNIVEKIMIGLSFEENLIYKAKIACLLHDVGVINGKNNHAYTSFVFAKEYFEKNNIFFDDIDLVLDAIKLHSDGFETTNIIALVLILADKLDIKKSRISEEGRKIIGNRQYSHINDIKLNINNSLLTINFITDGDMDLKEFSEYYFTQKVFKVVEAFSNKFNLEYLIEIDDDKLYGGK